MSYQRDKHSYESTTLSRICQLRQFANSNNTMQLLLVASGVDHKRGNKKQQ